MVNKVQTKGSAPNWKKTLSKLLKDLGLIGNDFTGKILIDLNQGGVRSVDKTEQLE